MNLRKVLASRSHQASKQDQAVMPMNLITTRTDTTMKSEKSGGKSNNEQMVSQIVSTVTKNQRRNMKKSREERYTDDMQSQTPQHVVPTIEVSADTASSLSKFDSKLSDISSVKFLCKGSHSRVFKGIYHNKTIIIKVLADSSVNKPIAQMEFKLEKDILSRISHPNILSIIGCGQVSSKTHANCKRPLMILEALTGGTLSYHLNKHKRNAIKAVDGTRVLSQHFSMPFSEIQFVKMAKQFADALWYLHEKFAANCILIHRDLKPDNIGFSEDGVLKLMDFGLSTTVKKNATESDLYELSGCTGSYRYMAPEVALNKAYNEKVDLYSFGLILYETLTGITPFQDNNKEEFYIKVVRGNERPSFYHDEFGISITCVSDSKFATVCDREKQQGFYLNKLKQFIESCWDPVYTNRPSAKEAFEMFHLLETVILSASSSDISTDTAIEEESINYTSCKKSSIVNNNRVSMLASQGDYSWSKESVNAPFSGDGNNCKDGNASIEASLSVTLLGSQRVVQSPVPSMTTSRQQYYYQSGKPAYHTESNLQATMSTSSLYSTSTVTSINMERQNQPTINNTIININNASGVTRTKTDKDGFISRSYHAFLKHLTKQT